MSREENNGLMFGLGILAGVVAGITAGVLLAPQSGEETRKQLKEGVEDLNESSSVENFKKRALISADIFRYKIERAFRHLRNSVRARRLAKAKDKEHTVYGI